MSWGIVINQRASSLFSDKVTPEANMKNPKRQEKSKKNQMKHI